MVCPVCGSDEAVVLKNKVINAKSKDIRELLLKCDDCGSVYKETITQEKPKPFRLIISEHENTHKIFIDLFPDEELHVGDYLMSELGKVKITSLELDDEKRVDKTIARDIRTIWASSEEIPARFGVSIDLHGKVASFKCETERDFKISVDDIIKIDKYIARVHVIKTEERKTTKGFARAKVIKRVYAKPVKFNRFDYDLSDFIVSFKPLNK
ncbi:HVO_0476 family zinc finger protein [uncultured Methanobrevibacter sp.]|uniref:HVO_0476 family zinc finger protein n=1 Tax=uncultured Methanobrevibacter sp. TaxID=253161 RepID=UPI002635540F